MQVLSVQKSLNSPLNAKFQSKVTDENANEAGNYPTKAKSLNNRDRILLDIDENFDNRSPLSFERRECDQIFKALLIENNSSRSTADSISSLPARGNSPSLFSSEDFIPEFLDTVECDDVEREYFLRCVVLGAKDTGKHALINSNFNEEVKRTPLDKNSADFLVKTSKQVNTTKKYHFWVRTLEEEQSVTKDALWKTYYKWANAFVFVYDTTNKESFEALQQEVNKVLQVVPQEEFFGVLVGMKSDQHSERAVDYEDVFSFKLRHNFSHLLETSSFTERDTPQLLQRLNKKLKLTFEAL